MRARERIVRARFADHKCAHCGAPYPGEGVVILAKRSSTWMVMVSCSSCLRPGVFLVTFPPQPSSQYDAASNSSSSTLSPNASIDVAPISPAALAAEQSSESAAAPSESMLPVTAADVNAMHEFLANFNGNFSKLFPKPQ